MTASKTSCHSSAPSHGRESQEVLLVSATRQKFVRDRVMALRGHQGKASPADRLGEPQGPRRRFQYRGLRSRGDWCGAGGGRPRGRADAHVHRAPPPPRRGTKSSLYQPSFSFREKSLAVGVGVTGSKVKLYFTIFFESRPPPSLLQLIFYFGWA